MQQKIRTSLSVISGDRKNRRTTSVSDRHISWVTEKRIDTNTSRRTAGDRLSDLGQED